MAKKNDIPNKGHKHLFGTSEKSDFILNMTAEGAQKMCGFYSVIALLIVAIAAIPAYFTQSVVDYTMDDGQIHYLSENFIFYAGAAVMLAGFVGFLVFMIACSKKQVSLKDNKSLLLALAVMLLTAIGCIFSANLYTAVLGYLGRHEGLITAVGYWGLFSVAMAVTADKRRINVTDFIVGLGLFQSIAAIFQAIPATSKVLNNFFEYLYVRPGTDTAAGEMVYDGGVSAISGIYTHSRAASGFTTSPYALAAVISVAFAAALAGASFDKSKKRKIFYGISAPIMAAAACLTRVIPAVIGISAGALIVLIIAVVRSFRKGSSGKSPAAAAAVLAVCSAIVCTVLFVSGATDFKDEQVIFTDGYVMRSITYYGREDTEQDIYSFLRSDGLYVASQNPLFGVGCDNQPYEFTSYGTLTDRFYNQYIDIAAANGIPCLVVFCIFLLVTLAKAFKAAAAFIKGEGSWISVSAGAGIVAFLLQAFFNTSWVNSTLYLYIAMGLIWSFGALKSKSSK